MYNLIVYFNNRSVCIELWRDTLVSNAATINASYELLSKIDSILECSGIKLSDVKKIGYLRGPGSFTTARIVSSTCAALVAFRKIELYGFSIDQIIPDKEIWLECNSNLSFYFNRESWIYTPKPDIYTQLPNLGVNIYQLMQYDGNRCDLGPVYVNYE